MRASSSLKRVETSSEVSIPAKYDRADRNTGNQPALVAAGEELAERRSCRFSLPKRYKLPFPIRHGCLMAENVKIAVVGPELEELMFRAVPLIDHFLHHIFVLVQLKAKRSLVGLVTGVTLDVQPHGQSVSWSVLFALNLNGSVAFATSSSTFVLLS